jgi:hypothetical protein
MTSSKEYRIAALDSGYMLEVSERTHDEHIVKSIHGFDSLSAMLQQLTESLMADTKRRRLRVVMGGEATPLEELKETVDGHHPPRGAA